MKDPTHETCLAVSLSEIGHKLAKSPGCAPVVATRVCALARSYRRFNEASCNRELTEREEKKKDSLMSRAMDMLKPYGLGLDHPYGLSMYVGPLGKKWRSSSELQVVA